MYRKSINIIKNALKIEEKFSDVPKKFIVGLKKGLVGFPFFFVFGLMHSGRYTNTLITYEKVCKITRQKNLESSIMVIMTVLGTVAHH